MRKESEELIKEEEKPRIVAFLHVTKDGKITEKVGLEKISIAAAPTRFVSNSIKLIESASELGSKLGFGRFQTISMIGKKGKLDLQLLLHMSSPVLYGITFTHKPSIEEVFEEAFRL